MFTPDYTVRLEQFEGPLDLLLHLIRRDELDAVDIPVARITEQYLKYLERIDKIDVEAAGEFLVAAATLVELKSRLVSPDPANGPAPATLGEVAAMDAHEDNPAAELIRQLLAYRAFRDAADRLDKQRHTWSQRIGAHPAASDQEALDASLADANDLDMEDLGLYDLVEAFQKIIETVQFDRLGAHNVVDDDTPIELHAADILDRIRNEAATGAAGARGGLTLRAIFTGRSRGEMIGLFLATLELVRRREVEVAQDESTGEITLIPGAAVNDPAAISSVSHPTAVEGPTSQPS